MPSLSPGPTQRQVPGSVEEGMGCVFYKWGMRLDRCQGSQMLPDTKAQCRSDEANVAQAQLRAGWWGKWGLSHPQELLASGKEHSNLPGSSPPLSPLQKLQGLRDG